MAEIQQPDYDLARQLGFYGAGGRAPGYTQADQFNKGVGTVGNIANVYDSIINNSLAQKQTELKNQIAQQELTENQRLAQPIDLLFGKAPQANMTAGTQAPSNVAGAEGQTITQAPTQSTLPPRLEPYKNLTLGETKAIAPLAGAQFLYANPNNFSDVSVSPDPTHSYPVPQKEGLNLGVKNPTVEAISGQEAINRGQVKKDTKVITPMQQGLNPYANVKGTIAIMGDLPSRSGANTPAGGASTVQFSARQGMELVANPGSPQRLALSAVDLARTVQRNAPTVDTLTNAGFADNLATKLSLLSQKITADPNSKDVPLLRQEIFSIFKDLDSSAKPIIQRQLDTTENIWKGRDPSMTSFFSSPEWQNTRKAELGENLPAITFNATNSQPVMYANNGIQRIQSSDGGKTWSPVK